MTAAAVMFSAPATGHHALVTQAAIVLCSEQPLAGDGVPEWVHLLPAGEVRTQDGRGPYRAADVAALMAASLPEGGKLVLDENHSTDLAAPKGASAPAMGWIVELQARSDGIWGRVDWTGAGRRLVEDSIERAPTLGFTAIQFNFVFAANPARSLYERLGWTQVGVLPGAAGGDDAVIYWRTV